MSDGTRPGMAGPLAAYLATLLIGAGVTYGLMQAWWHFTGQGFPLLIAFLIVPMMATISAANSHAKKTGRVASLAETLLFGLLATAILLALPLAMWRMGWLEGLFMQIDPYAMRNGMETRPLTTLLVMTGAIGLLCNIAMFWAGTKGEARRKARLAAKE